VTKPISLKGVECAGLSEAKEDHRSTGRTLIHRLIVAPRKDDQSLASRKKKIFANRHNSNGRLLRSFRFSGFKYSASGMRNPRR